MKIKRLFPLALTSIALIPLSAVSCYLKLDELSSAAVKFSKFEPISKKDELASPSQKEAKTYQTLNNVFKNEAKYLKILKEGSLLEFNLQTYEERIKKADPQVVLKFIAHYTKKTPLFYDMVYNRKNWSQISDSFREADSIAHHHLANLGKIRTNEANFKDAFTKALFYLTENGLTIKEKSRAGMQHLVSPEWIALRKTYDYNDTDENDHSDKLVFKKALEINSEDFKLYSASPKVFIENRKDVVYTQEEAENANLDWNKMQNYLKKELRKIGSTIEDAARMVLHSFFIANYNEAELHLAFNKVTQRIEYIIRYKDEATEKFNEFNYTEAVLAAQKIAKDYIRWAELTIKGEKEKANASLVKYNEAKAKFTINNLTSETIAQQFSWDIKDITDKDKIDLVWNYLKGIKLDDEDKENVLKQLLIDAKWMYDNK